MTTDIQVLMDELRKLERALEVDIVPPTDWAADVLRRAISALAQAWQPIATAPRDGTPIRVYADWLAHPDFNVTGSVEAYWQDDEGWIGAVWESGGDVWVTQVLDPPPTQWMPLPPPPPPSALEASA